MVSPQPVPVAKLNFGQLNVSNHLLGNREALRQAWAGDGYWYFKGVLDQMQQILGDDPFWLPITEYRANPPGYDPARSRFIYPHQDGFYSCGMPMKICWIPVDSVDEDVGGCAWVIPNTFKPGEQVIVNALDGSNATLMRSIH